MSTLKEFARESLQQLHAWWDDAVSDLSPEQLHFIPDGKGNHIGFLVWHVVRTEDNLVQFIFRDRTPTVWLQGGYDQRFGLHRTAQGTGMTHEEATGLRLPPVDQWMEYQRNVWQATMEWFDGLDENSLQRTVRVMPFGEIPMSMGLRQVIINHGFIHLGEAHHLRTLQGLKTTPI